MYALCQICPLIPPSKDGVGASALKLHRIFKSRGIASFLITSTDQQGVEGVSCSIKSWTLPSAMRIIPFVRRQKVHSVLIHYPSPRYYRSISIVFLPWVLRMAGLKVNVLLHEYSEYSHLGKLRILMLILFANLVLVTDSINRRSLSRIPLIRKRLCLFPTGSNISSHYSEEDLCVIPAARKGKLRILYFGLIRAGKGLDKILDMFDSRSEIGERVELHVIGGTPEASVRDDVELLNRIRQYPFIVLHGYLDDHAISEMFAQSEIVLLPYEDGLTERRGSFMAAMASGKPVVTSLPSIAIEGLQDNYNVIFLPNNSHLEIAATLMRLSEKRPSDLSEIGSNAIKWYTSHYSDSVLYDRLVQMLRW